MFLPQTVSEPPELRIKEVVVERADDVPKSSDNHAVMVQHILQQEPRTSGTSPDSIHVRFDGDVEVMGVLISVDIGAGMPLVEVAAGINARRGYGMSREADWLLHTSWTGSRDRRSGEIDEHIWFGKDQGFQMTSDDHLAIGAWLQNVGSSMNGVSPEVIIYYRWL